MSARFRVVAIIAARNEGDLIAQVIQDLISQGVEVYLIDDGSADDTVSEASQWLGRGLIGIERRPDTSRFEWTQILERKQGLSTSLDADWFIHHDADEFRQSPWPELNLREAIRQVDGLGYNAIDFRLLDFQPTHDGFVPKSDVREAYPYYEPARPWDVVQVKAWKRGSDPVDLVSSGGHEAAFPGRRIFPVQFLVRHYPIRSQAHGARKVFTDRQPRFAVDELERGWHVQYGAVGPKDSFIKDPSTLIRYDPDGVLADLQVSHRESVRWAAAEAEAAELRRLLGEAQVELSLSRAECAETVTKMQVELAVHLRTIDRLQDMVATERRLAAAKLQTAEAQLLDQKSAAAERQQSDTQEIRNIRAELTAVYASKSWLITQPLRSVYGYLRPARAESSVDSAAGRDATTVDWGTLARLSPISPVWGTDRGTPVDRHYIDQFLEEHSQDIRGHVLEVKDAGYSRRYGGNRVTQSSVLDVTDANRDATVIGDLSAADSLPVSGVDCFILTQTLHIIYDMRAALRHAMRLLKPGGVLLCTLPAVSRVNYEDGGLETGDYWRLTRAAVRRLFEELPDSRDLEIHTYGNVRTCTAFLYGLATEELAPDVLAFNDPWFPLIHVVRIAKVA